MTLDETPRGPGGGGEGRRVGAPRSTTRDLERYAGLFARRTQGMKSSAMRDLMAVTAQPEGISLAGGLPDTSTFPAEDFAALMAHVAADSAAAALQYGPTEGLDDLKACIVQVMAAEGMDVEPDELLVTTGGQQVIDLVCKTLLDPGDVVIAEAPTYPGAVPVFCSYQADVVQIEMDGDGMRVDRMEAALDRLDAEGRVPKFIYTVPSFQNPAGVTLSLERRRRLVQVARERELLVLEDNPYGLLRYEGEPRPTLYALDGGEYVIYLGTFSKILSPGLRLGWTAPPRPALGELHKDPPPGRAAGRARRAAARAGEAHPRKGRHGPLLRAPLPALGERVLRGARRAALRDVADRAVPPAPRHDARRARRALPRRGGVDAPRGRALHLGDAARLHRHHRPARARAA